MWYKTACLKDLSDDASPESESHLVLVPNIKINTPSSYAQLECVYKWVCTLLLKKCREEYRWQILQPEFMPFFLHLLFHVLFISISATTVNLGSLKTFCCSSVSWILSNQGEVWAWHHSREQWSASLLSLTTQQTSGQRLKRSIWACICVYRVHIKHSKHSDSGIKSERESIGGILFIY